MAVATLQQAIALDPLLTEAYLLQALAHRQLGNYAEAVSTLKELLKFDPQHAEAKSLLSECESQFKQWIHSTKRRD
nr:tetratricopeptide repeat protein [Paenibacillus turpanensis]